MLTEARTWWGSQSLLGSLLTKTTEKSLEKLARSGWENARSLESRPKKNPEEWEGLDSVTKKKKKKNAASDSPDSGQWHEVAPIPFENANHENTALRGAFQGE